MQELKTVRITLQNNGHPFEFSVNERDGDDSISYDVFFNGAFLMSVSPKGEILFKSDTPVPGNIALESLVAAVKNAI